MMSRTAVLRLSAGAELATGVALLALPRLVASLLLGAPLLGVGALVARCFGAALIALGLAAWPRNETAEPPLQALRAMVCYNGLITVLLGLAWYFAGIGGPLFWPAVLEHAVVALLLMRPERS